MKLGADVNVEDVNGDTPLHLALSNKKSQTSSADFDPEEAPSIFSVCIFYCVLLLVIFSCNIRNANVRRYNL